MWNENKRQHSENLHSSVITIQYWWEMNEDKLNDVADFYTVLNLHQFHQGARKRFLFSSPWWKWCKSRAVSVMMLSVLKSCQESCCSNASVTTLDYSAIVFQNVSWELRNIKYLHVNINIPWYPCQHVFTQKQYPILIILVVNVL